MSPISLTVDQINEAYSYRFQWSMAPSVTWHLILREYAYHEQFLGKFPTRYKIVNFQAQNFAFTFTLVHVFLPILGLNYIT